MTFDKLVNNEKFLQIPLEKISQSTFNSRSITLATISHSHLSNCYWYSVIFRKSVVAECFCSILDEIIIEADKAKNDFDIRTKLHNQLNEIEDQKRKIFNNVLEDEKGIINTMIYLRALEERFNGEIFPYSPHPDFKFEFETLMTLKMLHCSSRGYDVIFKGKKIGEIDIL